MNRIVIALCIIAALCSCNGGRKDPDVSNIKVNLEVQRFEQDFFGMDTVNLDRSLDQLNSRYPKFLQPYVFSMLSGSMSPDTVKHDVKAFLRSYRPLYDSTQRIFKDISPEVATLKKALQYTKHYFPHYQLPDTFITFLAPLDLYFKLNNSLSGAVKIENVLGAGLQLYMGNRFSVYDDEAFRQTYPGYVARRFSKEYIPVNCISIVINDMYPADYRGKNLLEQMIDAGRRLYVLDHLLPAVADTLKTGYTAAQLKGAYDNEAGIWSVFITNNLLYTTDPTTIRDYMNDAPNTTTLGPASPGFIGQFLGWQIVKKWMDKNEKITLEQLMKTPPLQIFEEAKYKPT